MGNSSSNSPEKPNVSMLANTMNMLVLKTGYILEIPVKMISNNPNISIREINDECMTMKKLNSLGVRCIDIDPQRRLVKFMVTEFYNERQNIAALETGILDGKPDDENKILEYHTKIARRVWVDLDEYVGLLDKLVGQKIKKLKINDPHIIDITANYWSSDIDGRYLYELGEYAIRLPYLRDMILERLTTNFKDKQIIFKNLVIKSISTAKIKRGVQFLLFIDITKT